MPVITSPLISLEKQMRSIGHDDAGRGYLYYAKFAKAIADASGILIVGPAQEKDFFAKFLAQKHPAIRAHVEGVEKADHPSDGELLDFARRYAKAADRMRPQMDPSEPGKP